MFQKSLDQTVAGDNVGSTSYEVFKKKKFNVEWF